MARGWPVLALARGESRGGGRRGELHQAAWDGARPRRKSKLAKASTTGKLRPAFCRWRAAENADVRWWHSAAFVVAGIACPGDLRVAEITALALTTQANMASQTPRRRADKPAAMPLAISPAIAPAYHLCCQNILTRYAARALLSASRVRMAAKSVYSQNHARMKSQSDARGMK